MKAKQVSEAKGDELAELYNSGSAIPEGGYLLVNNLEPWGKAEIRSFSTEWARKSHTVLACQKADRLLGYANRGENPSKYPNSKVIIVTKPKID